MFASKTLREHVLRGVIGASAFAVAIDLASAHPWFALLLAPVGLVAFRGCPTCWTMGLVETLAARAQGRRVSRACVDGECSLRSEE